MVQARVAGAGRPRTLPGLERWLYAAVWLATTAYCCISVYNVSQEYKSDLNELDFVEGWTAIGKRKDASNFEWYFWSSWVGSMWPWLLGHVIIGQVARTQAALWQKRKNYFLSYNLFTIILVLGPKASFLVLGHSVLTYVAALSGYTIVVWLISLALLTTLNYEPFTEWMRLLAGNDPYEQKYYLIVFTVAMCNIRNISACLEIARAKRQHRESSKKSSSKENDEQKLKPENSKQGKPACDINKPAYCSLTDFLLYVLYLPLFFTGPILTYDKFCQQFHQPPSALSSSQKQFLAMKAARVVFWALMIEVVLHFMYFSSLQHSVHLMEKLPLWALAGVGYCQGQFFMVKYLVMFGAPAVLASLDQLQPPEGPKCISHIYLYSQMWKYFDRGLYSFLKRHIYIPLGGSQQGLLRQFCASAACFSFIYYWHGAEDYLLVWTLLNFLGITAEALAGRLSCWPTLCTLENVQSACVSRCVQRQWLSMAMSRRLRAVLSVPLFAMSIIAIFYFLGGKTIGYMFFQRLIIDGFPVSTCTVSVCLYCCVQTSMEIQLWEANRKNEKSQ